MPGRRGRNERKRKAHKRFEIEMKMKEVKIMKLQRKVVQLGNQSRLKLNISTSRVLPDFCYDQVQYLPEGSVKQLFDSVKEGTVILL